MSEIDNKKSLILLIDDNQIDIKIFNKILLKENYKLSSFCDLKNILTYIKKYNPDLILVNKIPGETNGFQICKMIKNSPEINNIPIIIFTGKINREVIINIFQSGAADYILKPINPMELIVKIKTQIELKKSRDILEEKNKKLEELNNLKNEFLGIAAHDLRNPITVINMGSEFILDKEKNNLSENQLEILEAIKESSDFMTGLLEELLDITVIESGKISLNMSVTDYIKTVKSCVSFNRFISEKKEIILKEIYETQIAETEFDENKVKQVLNNFITNAIKFSHSRTEVTIRVKRKKEYIITEVIDNGQGISEEDIKKIFNPFPKISPRPTGGEKSTGLGLAITKKIVEAHGGTAGLESRLNEGSRFYFTLPVK